MKRIYIAPSVENLHIVSESQILSESLTRIDEYNDLPIVPEEVQEDEEIGAKGFSWGFEEYGFDEGTWEL